MHTRVQVYASLPDTILVTPPSELTHHALVNLLCEELAITRSIHITRVILDARNITHLHGDLSLYMQTAAHLLRDYAGWHYLIVGETPARQRLQVLARMLPRTELAYNMAEVEEMITGFNQAYI